MCIYIYNIYIYMYIYVIQGKNNQHFDKNISTTAFINSFQHAYIPFFPRMMFFWVFKRTTTFMFIPLLIRVFT